LTAPIIARAEIASISRSLPTSIESNDIEIVFFFIQRIAMEVAKQEGAVAVAHGCTGKGNDQVRFDVSINTLAPDLKIIAPVREWSMTRDNEIAYAAEHNIPISATNASPYSTDQNLWGRSIECGILEDPWAEPPEEVYAWTKNPDTLDKVEPTYLELTFEHGIPVALNGEEIDGVTLIESLISSLATTASVALTMSRTASSALNPARFTKLLPL